MKIGWAKVDVTPAGPCMLAGQMYARLATSVLDPLNATVLALESGNEKVIMISLDSVGFRQPVLDAVRNKISKTTGVPPMNIIGFATHTHTAPQCGEVIPKEYWTSNPTMWGSFRGNIGIDIDEIRKKHPDFVDSRQYADFLMEKLTRAAQEAWDKRAPGKIAYGQGSAAVGECRRLVMKGKGGVMYAQEDSPGFLNVEGHVDHTLGVMATYTPDGKLTGLVINTACPSQVCAAWSVVSADFWHDVRQTVAERWGKDVFILPQCSAAGDMSPNVLVNRNADQRMMILRGQMKEPLPDWSWKTRSRTPAYCMARRMEIARRIRLALEDVLGVIGKTADSRIGMKTFSKTLQLPPRKITEQEYKNAIASAEKLRADMKQNGELYDGTLLWHLRVVDRYEHPRKSIPMVMHVIRVGNAVFATNSFELYLDYGDRIKAYSKADQTFLIQLTAGGNGTGSYLPSPRSGGSGYGSAPASSTVSYEAGDIIVQETTQAIADLFR